MPATGSKVNKLSMAMRYTLLQRLQNVLERKDEDKDGIVTAFADYREGFSDKTIAEELRIQVSAVGDSRRKVFGNFSPKVKEEKRKRENPSFFSLEQQIVELRSRVRYLERSLGIDEPPLPVAEDMLGVAK